jgi:hypothetical protein
MAVNTDAMTDEEFERYIKEGEDALTDSDEEVEVDDIVDDATDEETNDETDEDLEQPDDEAEVEEDSDDDETDEEETDDDTEEESDEEATASDSDDQPTKSSTEVTPQSQVHKIKADGMEFQFTTEELIALAPKALNYTKKMQRIKPFSKFISAAEENGLTDDDLSMLIDAYKGDKNAVASIIKRSNVDPLELDMEQTTYTPKSYGRSEKEIELQEVVSVISKDVEFTRTERIVDHDWDAASRAELLKDPAKVKGLHIDVKTGVYDLVMPMAEKLKAFDGGNRTDLEYYLMAAKQMREMERQRAQETAQSAAKVDAVKKDQDRREATKKAATKRKAATPTKVGKPKPKVTDYLADDSLSDEEFERLMEKQLRMKG